MAPQRGEPDASPSEDPVGILIFSINVTLD